MAPKKPYIIFFFILLEFFLFISLSSAAVLHWSPVASTDDCTIAGYKVNYGTTSGVYTQVIDVGDVTLYDLDLLALVPTQTYYFAVNAYSTTDQEGPLSSPVTYRDSPSITGYPVIDHAGSTIDVAFNENNMIGADVKANYTFSPTLVFDTPAIARTDKTYRLYMNYIPQYTIITLTLSNITDNRGNALISNSIVLNDDDTDSMADDWESHYGISSAFLDADNDGLENRLEYTLGTSPIDDDSDDDGMDDAWEVHNGLNPLLDDADGDLDGDGITNIDEYFEGTGVSNSGPEKPVLYLPANHDVDVGLTPQLSTTAYDDPENDAHKKTQWQISTEPTFTSPEKILLELEMYQLLTELTIPGFILEPGQTYYWRVRFFDILDGRSLWSDPFSFTTLAVNPEDPDGNGVPDIQQVTDGTIDLDNDGYFDVSSSTYKMVSGSGMSFGLEASSNVTKVDFFQTIDPDDISDTAGKPSDLDFGLIQFKISVNHIGDAAQVKIYFSQPVGTTWYKYDLSNGWTDYSRDYPSNVEFSSDRRSLLLRLVDGGAGDSDGVANGVIVDPSGPGGIEETVFSNSIASSASSGGGGCFIATAAFGSPIEKHVQVLRDFRDAFLLKSRLGTAFVIAYYRYSPPLADIIARHNILKTLVKIGLMPLIVLGYIIVYLSALQQCMIFLMLIGISLLVIIHRPSTRNESSFRKRTGYRQRIKSVLLP